MPNRLATAEWHLPRIPERMKRERIQSVYCIHPLKNDEKEIKVFRLWFLFSYLFEYFFLFLSHFIQNFLTHPIQKSWIYIPAIGELVSEPESNKVNWTFFSPPKNVKLCHISLCKTISDLNFSYVETCQHPGVTNMTTIFMQRSKTFRKIKTKKMNGQRFHLV